MLHHPLEYLLLFLLQNISFHGQTLGFAVPVSEACLEIFVLEALKGERCVRGGISVAETENLLRTGSYAKNELDRA